jgi:hypothetical protein
MNDLVNPTMDRFLVAWPPKDSDDPHNRLCEYIIDPNPLSECLFDEGGCD